VRTLPRHWRPLIPIACLLAGALPAFSQGTSHLIIDYNQGTGDYNYLNSLVGADIFYNAGYLGGNTIVANVEAGHIWYGHDAFLRSPTNTQPLFTFSNTASLNEADFHATAVGNVLAGSGYVPDSDPEQYYLVGRGMAPIAALWSGAIATEFSAANLGEFSTTSASTLTTYKAFFYGIEGQRPDVINSSWGGDDPAATSTEAVALDGMARNNPTVTFVVSAGNSGTATVSNPGNGYNNITVGSVGGSNYLDTSEFSSHGPADFYNAQTGQTITGVRAAVDIAAPGENLVAAAYLGKTGAIGASSDPEIIAIAEDTPSTDRYFLSMDGTSFSAPVVAGGVALLKDVAKSPFYSAEMGEEALDTRVIKSVIMASATETNGWNNGQAANEDGVIVTTQSLDYTTGAGALNLENAASVYVFGTTDVEGLGGGEIATGGWDLGSVGAGLSNSYLFETEFTGETELTVSLNWFAGRSFDEGTDLGSDLSFTDLNLQVWMYIDGGSPLLVAESISLYNNSEFLRISLANPGLYGITVVFEGMIYDLTSGVTSETYGLAWQATPVPEPLSPSRSLEPPS
jgi:hypothetical protein